MGYHADVAAGLKALVVAAVPNVSVVDVLEEDDSDLIRLPAFVAIRRQAIAYSAPEELDGELGAPADVLERWTWSLYVKGGGGARDRTTKGTHVDDLLEALRDGLEADGPTDDCGRLVLVDEVHVGRHGHGEMYEQTWTHERWTT